MWAQHKIMLSKFINNIASMNMFSSIVHLGPSDRGLAIGPANCMSGNPHGLKPCGLHSARMIAIDWSGSNDHGKRNISNTLLVGGVFYGATNATSSVDGCDEQPFKGQLVSVPAATASTVFTVGRRMDGYDRQFNGTLYELVVFPRTLSKVNRAKIIQAI